MFSVACEKGNHTPYISSPTSITAFYAPRDPHIPNSCQNVLRCPITSGRRRYKSPRELFQPTYIKCPDSVRHPPAANVDTSSKHGNMSTPLLPRPTAVGTPSSLLLRIRSPSRGSVPSWNNAAQVLTVQTKNNPHSKCLPTPSYLIRIVLPGDVLQIAHLLTMVCGSTIIHAISTPPDL